MIKSVVRLTTCRILFNGKLMSRAGPARGVSVSLKTFAQSTSDDDGFPGSGMKPLNKHSNPFAQPSSLESTSLMNDNEKIEADEEKRLKVLQLEADISHQEGRRVPPLEFFQDHHWKHVLTLPTKSARIKYYAYLWQIDMKKRSEKHKKEERVQEAERRVAEIRKERAENPHIIYGLGHTSMFLRFYDTTINHWQNNRLIRAMQFAPKIVMDCSYDGHMNNREATYAAKQLMLSFAENRFNDEPFDLHYCNVKLDSACMQGLKRYIPTMLNPEFPMNVHTQCFTELFPKQNLVYLTPHCREELTTYNADDIYVIGAMVDTVNNEPLSLAKAKRLGLRMARLPLDRYLQWGSGSGKSLTLNQMISIMLDLKKTGNWDIALKHVPRRKVVDLASQQFRERDTLEKRAGKLNIRIDQLLNIEHSNNKVTTHLTPKKLRAQKQRTDFDLDSWARSKKKRNQSSS